MTERSSTTAGQTAAVQSETSGWAKLSRRGFMIGMPLAVAGCATTGGTSYRSMYSARPEERFPVPALNFNEIDRSFLRKEVDYDGPHNRPGTIVVDPHERFLYFVQDDGRAMRYGVGVGRAGFAWSGRARIGRKAKWPTWTPPGPMIRRQPELKRWAGGMPGGLSNPLGARALYLYRGGRDTLYRLHGTNEPRSIGRNMSSGCIRLHNHDVIDLYERVPVGARVVVLS